MKRIFKKIILPIILIFSIIINMYFFYQIIKPIDKSRYLINEYEVINNTNVDIENVTISYRLTNSNNYIDALTLKKLYSGTSHKGDFDISKIDVDNVSIKYTYNGKEFTAFKSLYNGENGSFYRNFKYKLTIDYIADDGYIKGKLYHEGFRALNDSIPDNIDNRNR